MKIMTKMLLVVSVLTSFTACQTKKDQEVEAIAFKKAVVPQKENTFKQEFIKNVGGMYIVSSDGASLILDSAGNFKIGEVEFLLHDAVSPYQGVYAAATPVPNKDKKLYTYHGIEIFGKKLYNIPYKEPSFEKTRRISEKESPYAWEINTFRPENIDWKSGFKTVFATKQ